MKPWNIIQQLESNNSRLFKEQVVAEHIDNVEFTSGLVKALSPLVTFGVQQVPEKTTESQSELSWEQFDQLLIQLENRELTGHAARDAIENAMNQSGHQQWNYWYRRILIKDLRCGFSEKTVNKVRENTVPVFSCMLSHDGAKHEKKIKGECFVEYKYDGVRVIAVVKNGHATLYSRNGKLLNNFPHIAQALSKPEFDGLVFDGEVMSENFQALMKQVHRKENASTADAYLALFDVIPVNDFFAGKCSTPAFQRRKNLESLALNQQFASCIRIVDCVLLDLDTDAGQQLFAQLNRNALDQGYEGLMIKPVNQPYVCKRSHAWLKIKPYIEVTLEVTSLEEGTGRNQGRLGALVCEGVDDGNAITVNVGSGFSDDQRVEFWKARDSVNGQLVEVRADAITQNQDGSYSLRFPRFKTFRGFQVGEKL
jgi:DNA ligase-1